LGIGVVDIVFGNNASLECCADNNEPDALVVDASCVVGESTRIECAQYEIVNGAAAFPSAMGGEITTSNVDVPTVDVNATSKPP